MFNLKNSQIRIRQSHLRFFLQIKDIKGLQQFSDEQKDQISQADKFLSENLKV